MKVVLLTGSELRHTFFRRWLALSQGLTVARSYCEGLERSLGAIVSAQPGNELRLMHLRAREQSEEDFFRLFVESTEDRSNPIPLVKGEINSTASFDAIRAENPDLLICYGASIIREPLLSTFAGRFLNVHLGLSPYYRGSGTNYWPLVHGEPEYVGATFMHIDAGIDTGEVVHQIRARIAPGDMPAVIGNRLIVDMAAVCRDLILRWRSLPRVEQIPRSPRDRVFRKKDYTEESVARLYATFCNGLIAQYLTEAEVRCARAPILHNPAMALR
jgi:phosphoribosylglycinamide formyltransferase 1